MLSRPHPDPKLTHAAEKRASCPQPRSSGIDGALAGAELAQSASESVTGLTRYDLSRQFRIMFGTSPYRYLLMRRLEFARERIHQDRPLVEVALDAGFVDQAHFTRAFRSAFGLTPARYRALRARQRSSAGAR
jgi:AraC-like DNA-binding protein